MSEFTANALQTVLQGEDVAFTETPVCGTKCIVHRQGSGVVKLRGITNQCKARFLVSYSGNIQIPTGGTVEAISLAIAIDGEPLQSTRMIGDTCGSRKHVQCICTGLCRCSLWMLQHNSGSEYIWTDYRGTEQ